MLELIITANEIYNESTNKFIEIPECTLMLEHSLISISRWESKWKIPYFDGVKTHEQEIDYIRCMMIGTTKDPSIFKRLSIQNYNEIRDYIADPMTATIITTTGKKQQSKTKKKQIMTSEVIYAHMFALAIDIECQKWHINRLLTLIQVCNSQNTSGDKMSKKETAQWNREQNAARKAKLNTRG